MNTLPLGSVLFGFVLVALAGFVFGYRVARRKAAPPSPTPPVEDLGAVLDRVRTETASEGVALFDPQGLLLGAVGHTDTDRTGAWVGMVSGMLDDGRALGLCGQRAAFSLRDETGTHLRCWQVAVGDRALVLAAAGPPKPSQGASDQSLARLVAHLST